MKIGMGWNTARTIIFTGATIIAIAVISLLGIPSADAFFSSSPYGDTKMVNINDPVLNRTAYTLTIPANWQFDGAVVQGSSCVAGPFPVFRILSPDGLSGQKELPRLDWVWAENGNTYGSHPDCLPNKGEMSASDFLKYMVGVLQAEYVRPDANPELASFQQNISAGSGPGIRNTGDLALATARYHINKIEIEEHIRVSTTCSASSRIGSGLLHKCSAFVKFEWAPRGKYSPDTFAGINRSLVMD
jgi:hypothetical protein